MENRTRVGAGSVISSEDRDNHGYPVLVCLFFYTTPVEYVNRVLNPRRPRKFLVIQDNPLVASATLRRKSSLRLSKTLSDELQSRYQEMVRRPGVRHARIHGHY